MNNNNTGVTLIELLVSVAILGILAAVSIPALADISQHLRLKQTARQIYSDLQVARSLAIKHSDDVSISFFSGSQQWCYGISDHQPLSACDCLSAEQCRIQGKNHTRIFENDDGIRLRHSRFAGSGAFLAFSAHNGIATAGGSTRNGTIWLNNRSGEQVAIVISRLGRIRLCSQSEKDCPKP